MDATRRGIQTEIVLAATDLDRLLLALKETGYRVYGPTVEDQAIVYGELDTAADLPRGWTDEQDGGIYRLKKRDDAAFFGFAVGPHSWKKYLFPPEVKLWSAHAKAKGFEIEEETANPQKMAFLGVRACELAALGIQDRVFLQGSFVDPVYRSRRDGLFVVAVNCSVAGGTCFCVSMNTGPKAESGFDLSLTEVLKNGDHYFLVSAGSEPGREMLARLPQRPAETEHRQSAAAVVENTAAHMGRTLNTEGLPSLLAGNLDHPRWDEVAKRCLTCANCTMVCPTCFCSTVEDVTDLSGDHAERWRKWDSCFTMEFSYIAQGSLRSSARSRYRQWMTHKLSTWHDQFGSSGCVGCGRCITWCPEGIDITEEAKAIREAPQKTGGKP
ncbi:MAG: sulfite reductase subunit A [Nitrospinae bacterium CG11_big_fil_rev_8_21_14_0_20_56_8]|nr:MAG: sulfite reductase subunit A [Nitrospinae bacterium CG11_big_fil_rev_8_21_14_0_20_56_8]